MRLIHNRHAVAWMCCVLGQRAMLVITWCTDKAGRVKTITTTEIKLRRPETARRHHTVHQQLILSVSLDGWIRPSASAVNPHIRFLLNLALTPTHCLYHPWKITEADRTEKAWATVIICLPPRDSMELRRNELRGPARSCCAGRSEVGGQAASYKRPENASLFCGEFQLRKHGEWMTSL